MKSAVLRTASPFANACWRRPPRRRVVSSSVSSDDRGMIHVVALSRRRLLLGSVALALAPALPAPLFAEPDTSDLQSITGDARPISVAEREGRMDRARRLMRAHGI